MNSCANLIYILGALVCTLMIKAETTRGTPGVDYPNYPEIPKTSFRCSEQKYIPGFYADVETQCQVFHFCFENRHESFLCPTGMIFNQKILGCDSWYTSNCSLAPSFYSVNAGPVIDKARKSISGLLKIQDASHDNARASTSSVFEKISSLYELSTEQASLAGFSAENVVSESPNEQKSNIAQEQKLEITHENSIDKGSVNVTEVLESLIASLDKIKSKDAENEGSSIDFLDKSGDMDDSEEYLSQFDGFVYDPVSKQYINTNYDPSVIDWDYENEGYGDYDDILLHGENQPANIFENSVDELDEIEKEKVKLSKKATSDQNLFYMDEFSKRVLQAQQQSKSSRRKPVYVVLDDSDENSSSEHEGSDFVQPTESSYYSSPVSIDDLVSQSTEVPIQRRSEDYSKIFDQFQEVSDEGVEDIKAESPDMNEYPDDSQASHQFSAQSVSQSEREMLKPETDFLSLEYDEPTLPLEKSREIMQEYFQDMDPLAYSEGDVSASSDTEDALGFLGDEDSDDIYILSDENEPNMPSESIEETEYNADYHREEDFPYMYAISRESPGNNLYEDTDDDVEDLESEESDDDDPYVQWMGQRLIQYSPQSSQYLPSRDDYRFMFDNQDGNLRRYDPSVSYRTEAATDPEYSVSDMQTAGYVEGSEYSDAIPLEEPDADSYDYRYTQSDMQQIEINNYPYNEGYGYVYDANGIPYYGNDFYGETRVVPMEESTNSESNSESLSKQAKTAEYNLELEADGKMNAKSSLWNSAEVVADTGSENLGLDLPELTKFDRADADGQDEEIYYLVDTDEDAENKADELSYDPNKADELSYDPVTLDYTGEHLVESYPQADILDNLNILGETEYDFTKPSESKDGEADTQRMQHGRKIPASANESKSDSFLVSHATSVAPEDKSSSYESVDMRVNSDLLRNKNAENKETIWKYHTFESNEKLSSPTVEKHRSEGFEPAKEQSFGDFVSPSETFMNEMAFSNAMGFNPYGYNTLNMQQPFSMVDSVNKSPFTKKNGDFEDKENIDQTRLSKLSSLKDKVLSMKRGKFGMFKKSLKTI